VDVPRRLRSWRDQNVAGDEAGWCINGTPDSDLLAIPNSG